MSKSNNIPKWGTGNNLLDSGISITSVTGGGNIAVASGTTTKYYANNDDKTSTTIAHGLGITPSKIDFVYFGERTYLNVNGVYYDLQTAYGSGCYTNNNQFGIGYLNNTGYYTTYYYGNNWDAPRRGNYAIYIGNGFNATNGDLTPTYEIKGSVSADSTNIYISWSITGGFVGTTDMTINWIAIA